MRFVTGWFTLSMAGQCGSVGMVQVLPGFFGGLVTMSISGRGLGVVGDALLARSENLRNAEERGRSNINHLRTVG